MLARLVALSVLSLVVVATAGVSWRDGELTDPREGETRRGVVGRNAEGFELDLFRTENGEVHAFFKLPAGSPDFLDTEKPPALAPDGGPPHSVRRLEGGLTWVEFPVWNGSGQALTGLLRELMQGESLQVIYFLAGGGYKETTIPLAGAREVIASAFGIPAEVSPEDQERARELEEALLAEGERCQRLKGKKRQRCVETVKQCLEEAVDADTLRACLSAGDGR